MTAQRRLEHKPQRHRFATARTDSARLAAQRRLEHKPQRHFFVVHMSLPRLNALNEGWSINPSDTPYIGVDAADTLHAQRRLEHKPQRHLLKNCFCPFVSVAQRRLEHKPQRHFHIVRGFIFFERRSTKAGA